MVNVGINTNVSNALAQAREAWKKEVIKAGKKRGMNLTDTQIEAYLKNAHRQGLAINVGRGDSVEAFLNYVENKPIVLAGKNESDKHKNIIILVILAIFLLIAFYLIFKK